MPLLNITKPQDSSEVKNYLLQVVKLLKTNNRPPTVPLVIMIDNMQNLASLNETLSPLKDLNDRNFCPYIIGSMSQTNSSTTDLQLKFNFRYVPCANHIEPMKGFMPRFLKRRQAEYEIQIGSRIPEQLTKVLAWLPRLWMHLNKSYATNGLAGNGNANFTQWIKILDEIRPISPNNTISAGQFLYRWFSAQGNPVSYVRVKRDKIDIIQKAAYEREGRTSEMRQYVSDITTVRPIPYGILMENGGSKEQKIVVDDANFTWKFNCMIVSQLGWCPSHFGARLTLALVSLRRPSYFGARLTLAPGMCDLSMQILRGPATLGAKVRRAPKWDERQSKAGVKELPDSLKKHHPYSSIDDLDGNKTLHSYRNDRCSGWNSSKRSRTSDEEINSENLEMVEKSDHHGVLIKNLSTITLLKTHQQPIHNSTNPKWIVLDPACVTPTRILYEPEIYAGIIDCVKIQPNCPISSERFKQIFNDLCFAFREEAIFLNNDEKSAPKLNVTAWDRVLASVYRLSQENLIDRHPYCSCCFKPKSLLANDDRGFNSCKEKWNKNCRFMELMILIGRNYTIP
uniref:Uncharacterized protein n=1 Tax=Romanomermis culicivorax TaxID=13658 RepID=A0A915IZR0_ROMCU